MIRINEITVPLGADVTEIKAAAAKLVGVSPSDFHEFEIARESVDCRKKSDIKMIYSADVSLPADERAFAAKFEPKSVVYRERYNYVFPAVRRVSAFRPVIVGFGPAGMLCGLMLAKAGLNPVILERGNDVDTRLRDVKDFWENRRLNVNSNVQFGEGGAGTFSDGKLTTGIKDGRVREVFNQLHSHGAPDDIMYSAHPHIGTDKLGGVVKAIRNDVIALGGEVRFGCALTDIITANSAVQGVIYTDGNGGVRDMETDAVILATGHSARDTVETLYRRGVKMEKKPFSVGVRVEHTREFINRAQYGRFWNDPRLPAAVYKLSNHPLHGRGGYTFCMCPGGTVVAASSEEGGMVVNGMSEYARDGRNSNSAILCGIEPDYFPGDDPLAGIAFQRGLERTAFRAGGSDYTAPAQLVGDFLRGERSVRCGGVVPTCPTGVRFGDITEVLPPPVTVTIRDALIAFDRKINGFAQKDAVLTAPESRSSSPVRIIRDDIFQSNIRGLFPCGEGAGYAGGIVSAGVDGIRVAEAVATDER
ncbi:MAG: hypothetical protein K6G90_05455 [Clostridia bacterium]|nr:hypothetical protein [Clostridia bacterium]